MRFAVSSMLDVLKAYPNLPLVEKVTSLLKGLSPEIKGLYLIHYEYAT
jgi:hypothetical protein